MNKISVIMLVKNNSEYLEIVLENLLEFDEVVILDNGSTDNSIEIAQKFSNVVIYQDYFIGFGPTRNLAVGYAKNDWVLHVDSDEILEQVLRKSILEYHLESDRVYGILRKNYFNHLNINSSSWGNDWVYRLYNQKSTRYNDNLVHEEVIAQDNTINLTAGKMLHFSYNKIHELIKKGQVYSDYFAKHNIKKKRPNILQVVLKFPGYLIKNLIIKRGLFSGFESLVIGLTNSYFGMMRYAKLYLEQNDKSYVAIIEFTSNTELSKSINKLIHQRRLPKSIIIITPPQSTDLVKDWIFGKLPIQYQVLENYSKIKEMHYQYF